MSAVDALPLCPLGIDVALDLLLLDGRAVTGLAVDDDG